MELLANHESDSHPRGLSARAERRLLAQSSANRSFPKDKPYHERVLNLALYCLLTTMRVLERADNAKCCDLSHYVMLLGRGVAQQLLLAHMHLLLI